MSGLFRILFIAASINIPAVKSSINWDSACGNTKGCFPNCPNGCGYLVTWHNSGSSIQFTLQVEETATSVYVAVGFSNDYRMGEDSVVGCLVPSSTVSSYYNKGTNTEILNPANLGLSAASVNQSNGVITCSFTRQISNSADVNFFNLNNDYILMLVVGEAKQKHGNTELSKHEKIPWSSAGMVDFNKHYIVELYKLNTPIIKLHGSMMVLAWLLLVTVAIVTARYGKNMFEEKKLFGMKIWFQIHRGVMIVALICVTVGFISIFVEIDGYSQMVSTSSMSFVQSHPILGIVATAFMFLNPIMALFRPDGDHKLRWIFNWSHLFVGASGLFLAVLNTIFGYYLERSMVSDSATYVTIVHVVIVIIVCCVLEIIKRKSNDDGDESSQKKKGILANKNLPFIVLVILGVILLILSITVVGIIASS